MKGDELMTNGTKAADVVVADAGTIDNVNVMLLEMMKEVKGNPGKIPEAEAMTQIAGRIFDGLKVKVAAAGLMVRAMNG
jgi:hypothetical protein